MVMLGFEPRCLDQKAYALILNRVYNTVTSKKQLSPLSDVLLKVLLIKHLSQYI